MREKITPMAKILHDHRLRLILTLYHCTCLLNIISNIIYLDEDFSWSGLGLAGSSPWVRILHALAFHWIPITAPEKAKILKYLDMKGILGAVILRWSEETSVATSRAARRGRKARPALVDHLEEFGGNTLTCTCETSSSMMVYSNILWGGRCTDWACWRIAWRGLFAIL